MLFFDVNTEVSPEDNTLRVSVKISDAGAKFISENFEFIRDAYGCTSEEVYEKLAEECELMANQYRDHLVKTLYDFTRIIGEDREGPK